MGIWSLMERENMMMPRISIALVLTAVFFDPASACDIRESLLTEEISTVRINLNPAGAGLGFELEIEGADATLEPLLTLIREAEQGGGHKCTNKGAIRFIMRDGSVVGIGLLPGHNGVDYGLRLYDGDRFVKTYRVNREELLQVMEMLGVPAGDPAFVS